MDEAGKPAEPPAAAEEIVDDIDGGVAEGGTPENFGAGVGDGVSRGEYSHVPFPAEEIGRSKTGSPYSWGYRSALETAHDASEVSHDQPGYSPPAPTAPQAAVSALAGGMVSGTNVNGGTGGSGAGASSSGTNVSAGTHSGGAHAGGAHSGGGVANGGGAAELISSTAAVLGDKLDSGRQAVKQAVAATNSWITSRVKSEPSSGSSGAGSAYGSSTYDSQGYDAQGYGPVVGTADASAEDTVTAGARAGSVATGTATGDRANGNSSRSLWRDSYAPQQSASRPATPWSQPYGPAAAGGPAGPVGAGQQASGAAMGAGAGVLGAAAGGVAGATRTAPSPGPAAGYAGPVTAAWQSRSANPRAKRNSSRRDRRQAHLTLARVEPWSVMKFSFVVSVVAFIILFVAVAVLWEALSALGVFTSIQHTVNTISSGQGTSGTNISGWFSASRILGYTGMLGALNIVLITALSTIGAVVYNLISHTIGGIEVTLRETE